MSPRRPRGEGEFEPSRLKPHRLVSASWVNPERNGDLATEVTARLEVSETRRVVTDHEQDYSYA